MGKTQRLIIKQTYKNLIVGNAYTYKELLAILGEKETHNRESQYERWRKYFEFERKGRLYYILSVKETPNPDGRSKGNNRKYLDYFKDVLMYCLADQLEMEFLTQREWLLRCSIVQPNLFSKKTELVKELGACVRKTAGYYTTECQRHVRKFVYDKFHAAVKSLEKSGHVVCAESFVILKLDSAPEIACINEAAKIQEIYDTVLKDMNLSSTQEAYYKKKDTEFYKTVNQKLNEKYGYTGVYKVTGLKKIIHAHPYGFVTENKGEACKILSSLLTEGLTNHFVNLVRRSEEKEDAIYQEWLLAAPEDFTSSIEISFLYKQEYKDNMLSLMPLFLSL